MPRDRKVLIFIDTNKALTDAIKASQGVLWCVQMVYCTKLIGGTGSPNWLWLSSGEVGSGDNRNTSIHTLTCEHVHFLQRLLMEVHHVQCNCPLQENNTTV